MPLKKISVDTIHTHVGKCAAHAAAIFASKKLVKIWLNEKLSPVNFYLTDYIQRTVTKWSRELEGIYAHDVKNIVYEIVSEWFHKNMPPRSISHLRTQMGETNEIINIILRLKDEPRHTQGSKEWYEIRNNLVTASSAHKILATESKWNELLREKVSLNNKETKELIDDDGPLNWGKKYEPVSAMFYEHMHGIQLSEYGCIIHPKYKFIGASPDGIVEDKDSYLFGRMLEIKNIVNRNITGIPKPEYWVQMQLQLEVCDLEWCDFLETRFVEYSFEVLQEKYNKKKPCHFGSIVAYVHNLSILYKYSPLGLNPHEQLAWCQREMETIELSQDTTWYKNVHYELTEVSCVTVQRNRLWFKHALPLISSFWIRVQEIRAMPNPQEYMHDRYQPKRRKRILESEEHNRCLLLTI